MTRSLLAAFLLVPLAYGCAAPPPIPDGINQDRAIELARAHVGEGLEDVVGVEFGFQRPISGGVPVAEKDGAMWVVWFNASIDRPCGPSLARFCHVSQVIVAVDARTGDVRSTSRRGPWGERVP
jgi:hypothetical protein